MFCNTVNAHTLKFPVEAVVTTCFPLSGGGTSLSFTSEMEAETWVDDFVNNWDCSCTIEYTTRELPF